MIRRIAMTSAVLIGLGTLDGGSVVLCHAGDDPKPSPSVAERYREILAEYDAQQKAVSEAAERAKTEAEQMKAYETIAPDDAAFSRRMVDLAASSPKDLTSRDALIWVINKTYRLDIRDYGDEVGRAVRLLVDHFANDPEAVRVGLELNNSFSRQRDALMEGMYANAEGREAKGLARIALAAYLQQKTEYAQAAKQGKMENKSMTYDAFDDNGKPIKKTYVWPNEMQGYIAGLRMIDPDTLRKHAEALYEEVLSDYGDIPYITSRHRYLETVLKQPVPMWNYKPMTPEEISKVRAMVERRKTLAEVAVGNLDEMHHVKEGQAAPEIEGKDLDGRPMKLSDFRGKVVVLVFWGSWCGPCMREVPHERQLAEKYRDKPFAILGVNCREEAEVAKKTVEREKMSWPQWHDGKNDGGPIVEKYHIRRYPTLFVIDAKGVIRRKDVIEEALDKAVEDLLKDTPGK
jgi:thiol-disulfide isomerase/thioredoxin